jgi:arabinogalactan oligomer / maltooligosaccharide transport system permease protein
MSNAQNKTVSPSGGAVPSTNILTLLLGYLGLAILNAMGLLFVYAFINDDNLGLAFVFAIITVGFDIIFFVPKLYPIRWMSPGLALITLLAIYPIAYTVVTAFSNYGDGHRLTKSQVVKLIEERDYVPDDALIYDWVLYQNESGDYALWLSRESDDGELDVVFAPAGEPIDIIEDPEAEAPEAYEGYLQLDRGARARALSTVQDMTFGDGDDTAGIKNRNEAARPLVQRYVFDEQTNTFADRQTGVIYSANDSEGVWLANSSSADELQPGYRVYVGFRNFTQLYEDRTLLDPLIQVFIWTIAFAFLSVLLTFIVGLMMAIILDNPIIPYRKFWRSLLFIPYAIPGVISILVWRGMLNENLGIVTNFIDNTFGYHVPWFTDPWGAKVAILLVNLWLGYPYMMLICSGALQAISKEVYEAAAVDGAKGFQVFRNVTLPLLLVTVGPLLIASFIFNFNNFLLIEALTEGNPPIPGTSTPVGHTDILINYTYNLAFGAGRGADYGYASAISIIIFLIVATIALFQYRFTKAWEEVGENV